MRDLPQRFAQSRRLLIRSVNWLGDAVMSTPALLRLREALPHTDITLLCHHKLADLWHAHPAINRLKTFSSNNGLWSLARQLRKENFDAALVLPNSPRSALQMWLARIPLRVGITGPWRNLLLTHALPPRPGHVPMRKRSAAEIQRLQAGQATPTPPPPATAHHIFHYLHLVAAAGANPAPVAPHIAVAPAALEAARQRLGSFTGPLIGLNPGAEYGPAKRWPLENWITLAKTLRERYQAELLLLGGHRDADTTAAINHALAGAARDWAGKTSLLDLAATLRLCRLVVTNDTGPMHLAAAVGATVVALFGSTSPVLTGPGLPGAATHFVLHTRAPCAPCFLRECPADFRCLRDLHLPQVLGAVDQALRQHG